MAVLPVKNRKERRKGCPKDSREGCLKECLKESPKERRRAICPRLRQAEAAPRPPWAIPPAAIIIYKSGSSKSPDASFDCGLAAQNMVIAASALGYGVKIMSSPTMSLNGDNHDALCEKLGVDPSMQAVAVLLIGKADIVDATSSATTRESFETKTSIIQ